MNRHLSRSGTAGSASSSVQKSERRSIIGGENEGYSCLNHCENLLICTDEEVTPHEPSTSQCLPGTRTETLSEFTARGGVFEELSDEDERMYQRFLSQERVIILSCFMVQLAELSMSKMIHMKGAVKERTLSLMQTV